MEDTLEGSKVVELLSPHHMVKGLCPVEAAGPGR
jgi:hypothetical protein